ncbi:MAG: hypothetical protein ACT4N8_12555 [Sphingosinicella sp.]|uniref:hypothetical protein n=1 Tax=Sphingosinicella sp. TaxID=1917971 RepID=UPI00403826B2
MKTKIKNVLVPVGAVLSLGACVGTEQGIPLVFGRTQTVGISVAGSVPDQGAHLTIGFTDRNIAVVPTTQSNGTAIRSQATDADGHPFTDTLSVLGQFSAKARGGTEVSAGLGTFFSTGLAARNLAEGFRDRLRGFGDAAEANSVIPHPDSNALDD